MGAGMNNFMRCNSFLFKGILKFLTCRYIDLLLDTCYTCTVLTCTDGVTTCKCIVLRNRSSRQSLTVQCKSTGNLSSPLIQCDRTCTKFSSPTSPYLSALQILGLWGALGGLWGGSGAWFNKEESS